MAKKRAKSLTKGKAKPKPSRVKRKALAKKPVRKVASAKPRQGADPLDTLVDASARALALPLKAAWRATVKGNLDVTLRLAALFTDFPLPDDAEPAPVFVA
jgi:Protein of unknown function (DUF4089)